MKGRAVFGKEEVEVVSELPGLTIVKFPDGRIAGVNPEDLKVVEGEGKKAKAKKAKASGA